MPKLGYYQIGQANMICDQCGRGFKSSDISKRWDNALVCKQCWEPRQPQDFVRGITDNPSFQNARPRQDLPSYYINVPDPNYDSVTTQNDPTKFLRGDMDVRVRFSSSDQSNLFCNLFGKGKFPPGGVGIDSFFTVNAVLGNIQFFHIPNGIQTISATTTSPTGFANNTIYWLKVTYQRNVSGASVVKFYKCTDYDIATAVGSWTQIGNAVSGAAVTNTVVNQAPMTIGGQCISGTMRVYYGEVRSGLNGPIVYYCNPNDVTPSGTIASDNYQWQMVGSASVVQV